MRRIIVTGRDADVHAAIAGEPGKWGCGDSSDAAIGSLVRSWPEEFGITITVETAGSPEIPKSPSD